jgi:putative hydrolase of the HAD superfamily
VTVINAVIFDLGKVLVDFSYAEFLPRLRRAGASIEDPEDFAAQVGLVDYEEGRIDSGEFFQRVNALLYKPLDLGVLERAWCHIFTPVPQMLNLARQLRGRVKTAILSNTSEIHWRYLHERFHLDHLCDSSLASFELGSMKPGAEIYRLAAERFELCPENLVFIDDRHDNVTGARACGWRAIHHQSYGQTRDELQQLGISCP